MTIKRLPAAVYHCNVPIRSASAVYGSNRKPSQNSLFKADTRVRSVAENGILGLVQEWPGEA
jgi:hypothetical protein